MSKRLTMFTPYGYEECDPIDIYPNVHYSEENFKKILAKLGRYEDLEEQGRLIELPCAVGDIVYFIHQTSTNPIITCTNADEFMLTLCVMEGRFGKTVFLTREAAEAALKERENK